jgi:phosphate transport system permease protein
MRRRRYLSHLLLAATGVCTVVVLTPLAMILYKVVREGAGALNVAFLTHLPAPAGESGGGMANAVVGTLEMLAVALAVGLPLGLAGALYTAEMGREGLAGVVRFAADVLTGVPTIVTGLFLYALVVVPMRQFSALAGGLALAVILLPIVLRAGEEALRAVPASYREAALALGASRWQVWSDVLLPGARRGLMAAAVLGLMRTAGETAPLLLTSLNNSQWNLRLDRPMASLTVQLYTYATGPYDDWHRQAWAAALLLLLLVGGLGVVARWWGGRGEVL